jgi:hypothetical protein
VIAALATVHGRSIEGSSMASVNPITHLRAWARNSPWIVMAVLIHVMVIATMSVMYMGHKAAQRVEDQTSIRVVHPPAEKLVDVFVPPEIINRNAIPKN